MSDTFTVTRITALTARRVPYDWAWARDNAGFVSENWARRIAERPALFDGRVLLACACRIADDAGTVDLFEVAFSQFLAFRDAGSPDPDVANVFAAIVPRARDGAALLGVMGGHTANAGQIYFPCGTPDLADLREGDRVDLVGSAERELLEETGIALPPDAPDEWLLLSGDGQRAFLRPVHFPEDGDALLARMERHRRAEADAELDGFVIVRGAADIDSARMPGWVRTYLANAFAPIYG
ncbi:NUDIX hydrolase [Methylobacterium sp. BTF04]|uniref:NUDIX hydrolase n=1 Tax=Methylobacterium sp. BTF04 TaxID=2708300 RepID=UPI0013D65E9C|nr:NUDIX hydrolase [Methylobacterium sp. BTF04]